MRSRPCAAQVPRRRKEQKMAKVLVVEDNPASMKLTTLLLRSAGHSVLCVVDAEAGLEIARSEHPDLILMDIQLPGIDGNAATAILKEDPATASIPIITLIALSLKFDLERGQEAGSDAYIVKPLRYDELYTVMEELLQEPRRPPPRAPLPPLPPREGRRLPRSRRPSSSSTTTVRTAGSSRRC